MDPRSSTEHRVSLTTAQGVRRTWSRLLQGHSGLASVKDRGDRFAALPCQVAGVVPEGSDTGQWNVSDWLSKDVRMIPIAMFSAS